MRKLATRLKVLLANPTVRPVEIWLVRAAVAWVAVKLGVSVDHLAH